MYRIILHSWRLLAVAGGVLIVAAVPVAYYLASPLWIRTSLEETAPLALAQEQQGVPRPLGASGTVFRGEFRGADDFHFGRGQAILAEGAAGAWTLRVENFSVRNGPDLFVYLSPNPSGYADTAVNLGPLRATDGAFNYDVPAGTDLASARSVIVWCRRFSTLFAVAPLATG
jgi:hypothetical protein